MLRRFLSIKRFSVWTPPLQMDHRLLPAIPRGGMDVTEHYALSVKIPPGFSSIPATCIWQPTVGRGQPRHQAGCSQGCIRRSRLFPCLRGAQRAVMGFKSVLLLWSGRARDLSSSLLLLERSATGRGSPRTKWGWRCSRAL